ncbi:hypothetical protein GCM10009788_11540 [Nocardioides humi]|uniref:Uncharacterized protein n=1 Tax=Nocardioides humi TaxID=449461 RepID=A0ABN2A0U4_9ACTN
MGSATNAGSSVVHDIAPIVSRTSVQCALIVQNAAATTASTSAIRPQWTSRPRSVAAGAGDVAVVGISSYVDIVISGREGVEAGRERSILPHDGRDPWILDDGVPRVQFPRPDVQC